MTAKIKDVKDSKLKEVEGVRRALSFLSEVCLVLMELVIQNMVRISTTPFDYDILDCYFVSTFLQEAAAGAKL